MLYIVATPIGNLEDVSTRQARILLESDIILAEDTRSAHTLLSYMNKTFKVVSNPKQKIISYYREKEFEKLPDVLDALSTGLSIALISESGMPLVSDPGFLLVKEAIKAGIQITAIPGPSAVINSLILSGFEPKNFMYVGFLPKKASQLTSLITRLKKISEISPSSLFVAYESPNRINATLKIMAKESPEVDMAICREMSKKFEEVVRGMPADLLNRDYRGEITIVLRFE